jgi:transketolase
LQNHHRLGRAHQGRHRRDARRGADEVAGARKKLGWTSPPFEVPSELRAAWNHDKAGRAAEAKWQELFARYRNAHPALASEFERRMRGKLPANWLDTARAAVAAGQAVTGSQATRQSSQAMLNLIGPALPELFGGSADLTTSNSSLRKGAHVITPLDVEGDYLHYGVREFGMTAAMTGIALHGGLIPYGGTFLTFSDYARNAVRMASRMHQRGIVL